MAWRNCAAENFPYKTLLIADYFFDKAKLFPLPLKSKGMETAPNYLVIFIDGNSSILHYG
ncbi:hypothetical protein [Nostoc linckia]|uniref:hypothetical protein n=1 Tax=Nostoc linckia TaxID=92942 RepID=UPI0011814A83|nr:hypothetical protein [Nostoc linckia]